MKLEIPMRTRGSMNLRAVRVCSQAERVCDLVQMLRRRPMTRIEINAAIPVNEGTLRGYLRAMVDKGLVKMTRVSGNGGQTLRFEWIG